MAEVTHNIAMFPDAVVFATYDDTTFEILRIGATNNSSFGVTCIVKKLNKPARTYTHTWLPGETTSFSIPKGQVYYIWDTADNNITMPNLEIYVRYG